VSAMENFNFHRPKTVAEAVQLLGALAESKLLAGGQSLLPVMKLDMAQPSDLVSIAGIAEMRGVRAEGNAIVIGALTTHAEVARSEIVRKAIPGLSHLAAGIGDAQVRNRGTLGGSVAHADPAADYPAAVVALRAQVKTDRRTIDADSFFTGMFATALEPNEVVVEVRFEKPERAAYAKFANPASKYAVAGVFVAKHGNEVRVAVTGAGPSVFRVAAMEKALAGKFAPESVAGITVPFEGLNDERDARPAYRAHLVTVMAKRAVAFALRH
jgi:carbon-monoxide dehydrogenase medium subunit